MRFIPFAFDDLFDSEQIVVFHHDFLQVLLVERSLDLGTVPFVYFIRGHLSLLHTPHNKHLFGPAR